MSVLEKIADIEAEVRGAWLGAGYAGMLLWDWLRVPPPGPPACG